MPIQIPTDLTIVTLRAFDHELPQRFTEAYARAILQRPSQLLLAPADIEFPPATCQRVVEEMPPRDLELGSASPSRTAPPARSWAGSRATRPASVSLPTAGTPVRQSRILAHGLSHLLKLPHVDEPRREGPGAELTPDQVRQARSSALARRFGGR